MTTNEFIQELDELFVKQKYDRVEPFMLETLEEAKARDDYGLYLSVGNEMIGYYRSISRFQKAYQISEDMLLLMEELQMDQSAEFATVLLNTATAYSFDENFEVALQFYRRAEQIYHLLVRPDDYLFAGLYNNMSSLMEKMGKNEEALELLMKALGILQHYPDRQMEAATNFTNLGLLYLKTGDYESGRKCVTQAVAMFEALDTPASHYSAALSALGEICYHEKDYEQAIVWYERTLAEIEKHYGLNLAYAVVCENLAMAYREAGRADKAEKWLGKAQEVRRGLERGDGAGEGRESAENLDGVQEISNGLEIGDGAGEIRENQDDAGNSTEPGSIVESEEQNRNSENMENGEQNENPQNTKYVKQNEDPQNTESIEEKKNTENNKNIEISENIKGSIKIAQSESAKTDESTDKIGRIEKNALLRCREYYEQYGKPLLAQFPELKGHYAVGLVGEGSECFGYDDAISADHDYFPRFLIWLDDEAYEKYGKTLQEAYRSLPDKFEDYPDTVMTPEAAKRCGVCKTSDFYYRLLGRREVPESIYDWISLQETRLATVTNGEIFEDCGGDFTAQRQIYLSYFPEDVRKKKLAVRLRKMAQMGQYQYARCMQRGEYVAAEMALAEFIQYTGSCCFLLAKQYMPYFKWMHRRMKELPVLSEVADKLEKLALLPMQQDKWDTEKPEQYRFSLNNGDEKVVLIEEIASLVAEELRKQGLAESQDSYLEPYAAQVENKIEDAVLRAANLV